MFGTGDVRIETVPDACVIKPSDALVVVSRACICGSDLWPYKTMEHSDTGRRMGHEAIGVVAAIGTDVRTMKVGDLVVMPFAYSDGTCAFCHEGLHTSCIHGGFFGTGDGDGAQAEAVRVPQADGTLFVLPVGKDDALMPSLLTLSDVMGTGHHAAVAAKVAPGKRVAVIGDGAVGLCSVIAARRLGAEQIIILGRHADRIALAQAFGATDVVSERGDGLKIDHAGDTGPFSDMQIIRDLYQPDFALLPMGDLFTMGIREAEYACKLLKPKVVVPMHFGTFPVLTGDPHKLAPAAKAQGFALWEMKPGERRELKLT